MTRGSVVARTPGAIWIVGTGVARGVGTGVVRAVGTGVGGGVTTIATTVPLGVTIRAVGVAA